ncbi:hypothetical protein [Methanospirillum lacunae]|uniref:Uncharacterized protein n=1 Tax=Methanospirillum lacunae TaxID=668570 RepID=A0A2V2NCQ3_9EURY|nr:hypothetical protein [Methanospirillum lacunae]PWR74127.1 hypothetical protein DK846_02940 [Methanospirillum lacunae]
MNKVLTSVVLVILALVLPMNADSLNIGGPYTIGDQITISGETNFNTDNKVLVEVYPASFGPTKKYDPTMSGGNSTVVPVVKDETGTFFWSANMSSAGWSPDQYMVRAEVIGKDFIETSIITLIEKNKPDTPHSIVSMNASSSPNQEDTASQKTGNNASEQNLTNS